MNGTLSSQRALNVGRTLFVVFAAVAVIMGKAQPATQVSSDEFFDETVITNYLAITNDNGGFNWLFFSLFMSVAVLSFAVCYAGAMVAQAIENQTVEVSTIDGSDDELDDEDDDDDDSVEA